MATSIESRRVYVHVRAASDLKSAAMIGQNTPYLELTIAEQTFTTEADRNAPTNPIWDQNFEVNIPGATPGEQPLVLRVTAKNKSAAPLLPDTVIGRGSAPLSQLFATGKEEARIPLHGDDGQLAGVAFIGLQMALPEHEQAIPSSLGTVLGEVPRAPQGLAAEGAAGVTTLPTASVAPPTPMVGAVAPGNVDDPSSPAYGILR